MRILTALFLAAHGVAHLVGFVGAWRLAAPETVPYATTVLAGRVDLGDAGIRALGVLWLLTAAAFWLVAFGEATGREWWLRAAAFVALASLALSVLGWPEARIGVAVNVAILLALAAARRWAWT
jgi:hypothetical protein